MHLCTENAIKMHRCYLCSVYVYQLINKQSTWCSIALVFCCCCGCRYYTFMLLSSYVKVYFWLTKNMMSFSLKTNPFYFSLLFYSCYCSIFHFNFLLFNFRSLLFFLWPNLHILDTLFFLLLNASFQNECRKESTK